MLTKFRFDWRPFPYILCCSNETDTRGTGKTHVRILHRQQINMRQTVEMDAWVVLFSCRSIVLFVKRQEMMVPCWSTHYEFWTICCENLHRTTHHHYWFLSKCVPMVPIECCIYRWFLCPINCPIYRHHYLVPLCSKSGICVQITDKFWNLPIVLFCVQ